jgi:polyisoprenoid-binding protein YceI
VRGRNIAIVLVLASLAGLGVAYALFFTPATPEELAISESPGTAAEGGESSIGDPTGTWEVVPGSEAGYRVREKLARLPAPSDAVGRTQAVTGGLTVEPRGEDYAVKDVEVQVDVSKLESDSPRRDNALRTRGLETDRYPLARFVGQQALAIPQTAGRGETVKTTLEGLLTIHNVTKQVSIPVEARLNGDRAEVAGSFTFPMSEFDIEPPNVAGIVTVEPTGTMEFRLVLAKAA